MNMGHVKGFPRGQYHIIGEESFSIVYHIRYIPMTMIYDLQTGITESSFLLMITSFSFSR